jgi:hypothetical protein
MPRTRRVSKLALHLSEADRQTLEGMAVLKSMRLSTWLRAAALEKTREEYARLCIGDGAPAAPRARRRGRARAVATA